MENMQDKAKNTGTPFLNKEFMNSAAARQLRIVTEYIYPKMVFEKNNISDTIVFFGSARSQSKSQLRKYLRSIDEEKLSEQEKRRLNKKKLLSQYHQDASKLSYRLTKWSKQLPEHSRRFVICSGGGPGIMEAANRGASLAKGLSIGLNITLPHEQGGNRYITKPLDIEFHYFFMRKYWFMYLAKALVVFPGGFGTCDEMFEVLTLIQTQKSIKPIPIVLYGSKFWKDILNFEAMAEWGVIGENDFDLVHLSDSVDDAFDYLVTSIKSFYIDK